MRWLQLHPPSRKPTCTAPSNTGCSNFRMYTSRSPAIASSAVCVSESLMPRVRIWPLNTRIRTLAGPGSRQQRWLYTVARRAALAAMSGSSPRGESEHRPSRRRLTSNRDHCHCVVRPGADRQKREDVLQQWYRQSLREQLPALLAEWEPAMGVEVASCGIRKSKLAGEPAISRPADLDQSRTGEEATDLPGVHSGARDGTLLERCHNDTFQGSMDHFMPGGVNTVTNSTGHRCRTRNGRTEAANRDWLRGNG